MDTITLPVLYRTTRIESPNICTWDDSLLELCTEILEHTSADKDGPVDNGAVSCALPSRKEHEARQVKIKDVTRPAESDGSELDL